MRIKVGLLVATFALLSLPGMAQEGHSEVSANFTGNFQNQSSGFGVTDSPTYSGGLLLNYRYHFNRWSAVEVNYGYNRFTQVYSSGSFTQANTNEVTLAYVFTFGIPTEARFHPFAEAGTGALFFAPIPAGSSSGGTTQNRATLLYGAGITYRFVHNLNLQAGYRGLVYTAPDFIVPSQLTNARTEMAEPYVGVTLRF